MVGMGGHGTDLAPAVGMEPLARHGHQHPPAPHTDVPAELVGAAENGSGPGQFHQRHHLVRLRGAQRHDGDVRSGTGNVGGGRDDAPGQLDAHAVVLNGPVVRWDTGVAGEDHDAARTHQFLHGPPVPGARWSSKAPNGEIPAQ